MVGAVDAPSLPSRERGLKYLHTLSERQRSLRSLPSRERGLKWFVGVRPLARLTAAPFTGAWIEMPVRRECAPSRAGRSLRGSVD